MSAMSLPLRNDNGERQKKRSRNEATGGKEKAKKGYNELDGGPGPSKKRALSLRKGKSKAAWQERFSVITSETALTEL